MTGGRGAAGGARRYRIRWRPGSDDLHAECHCGARHRADDPVGAWEWLLAHPAGHLVPWASSAVEVRDDGDDPVARRA